jgi:hypothetical protein
MITPLTKFYTAETALKQMSKCDLIDYLGKKKFWPVYLTFEKDKFSLCSVHFTKSGVQKEIVKIDRIYPDRRFVTFGNGWDENYALYTWPIIPEKVVKIQETRGEI